MKKRFLALLLAVCVAASVFVLPASAAGSNAALQTAVMLGGASAEQAANPLAALTRGQLARLLVGFSAYRESASAQGSTGTLFSDVTGSNAYAPYIRIAVQQGWMSGYTDGSFKPDKAVTLEEACTAVLALLGYDVTALSGSFPAAQLNKAETLGLRKGISKTQGQGVTLEDGAVLLYNALAATDNDGKVYGSALGFTVTDGQVDTSSVLLSNVKGPFVASSATTLPFTPTAVYRNDEVIASADLSAYDVYYYNEDAQTVWIYTKRAAGRITAVSPSANSPTSVTVAGTAYTIGSSSVAYQLSSLSGGGVGQVVTLLLGMNDEAVAVLTGSEADEVFYGVVQSASRSLTETNGADVQQSVAVACTDGVTRTVNIDKKLNYTAGTLVAISVDENGESVSSLESRSASGLVSADASSLGSSKLADDVQILDTTSEGVAGTVSPSRLSGVTLSGTDVRYYTTNENGEIDRLILNDVTGDLWTYATLDDIRNLATAAGSAIDSAIESATSSSTGTAAASSAATTATTASAVSTFAKSVLPSTSDILYSIVDGSIGSTLWDSISNNSGEIAAYAMQQIAANTSGPISDILSYLSSGATYVCYENGEQVTYQTSLKYAVVAGGVAISKSPSGKVKNMVQLMPTVIDKVGAASVMSGGTRYETADDMQVYLWYGGQYFATTLANVNAEDYTLIGWYDNLGHAAGKKIRVLIAVKKD